MKARKCSGRCAYARKTLGMKPSFAWFFSIVSRTSLGSAERSGGVPNREMRSVCSSMDGDLRDQPRGTSLHPHCTRLLVEEAQNVGREIAIVFAMRHVPRARVHLQRSAWKRPGQALAQLGRHVPIGVAHDDQGRRLDPLIAPLELFFPIERDSARQVHPARDHRAGISVMYGQAAEALFAPRPRFAVNHAQERALRGRTYHPWRSACREKLADQRQHQQTHLPRKRHGKRGRRLQGQRADPARRERRRRQGDLRADAMTDDIRALDAQRVEHSQGLPAESGEIVSPRALLRRSAAVEVIRDGAVALRDRREGSPPRAQCVGEAVNQQDGLAVARLAYPRANPTRDDEAVARGGCHSLRSPSPVEISEPTVSANTVATKTTMAVRMPVSGSGREMFIAASREALPGPAEMSPRFTAMRTRLYSKPP